MRGQLRRASALLDEPDNPWRRRRILNGFAAEGKPIASGQLLRLDVRVSYTEGIDDRPLVFPEDRPPRPAEIRAMAEMACRPEFATATAARIAVIDIETTRVVDRGKTVPFLVGIGRFGARAFAIEQYFLEDYESEATLLRTLAQRLDDARALVTYNGSAFDLPLLRRRFALHDLPGEVWQKPHFDALPCARRLWRGLAASRSLTALEDRLFGFRRRRDIQENRIPELYRDYLGDRRAERLSAVFDHNAQDLLTTASLAVALARAYRNPDEALARRIAEEEGLERMAKKPSRAKEGS
jgi:hypothetical protein